MTRKQKPPKKIRAALARAERRRRLDWRRYCGRDLSAAERIGREFNDAGATRFGPQSGSGEEAG